MRGLRAELIWSELLVHLASAPPNQTDHLHGPLPIQDTVPPSFIVNSSSCVHIVKDRNLLTNIVTNANDQRHHMKLADGTAVSGVIEGHGEARFSVYDHQRRKQVLELREVYNIPSFPFNIISVHRGVRQGASFNFASEGSTMKTPRHTFPLVNLGCTYCLQAV